MERQRDDREGPLDDMNEETDSAQGEIFSDSDSIEAVILGGETGEEQLCTNICSRDDTWTARQHTVSNRGLHRVLGCGYGNRTWSRDTDSNGIRERRGYRNNTLGG